MSSQERLNIVRDRTLVLRVLVPGLHTSLNDKITAKNDGDRGETTTSLLSSTAPSSAATDPSISSSGGIIGPPRTTAITSTNNLNGSDILNLDGVTCLPSASGSTLWHFRCDGATYPARLVNLPCPVEVHKTTDHATYHKCTNIGQMLIVYEDEYAMEEAELAAGQTAEGRRGGTGEGSNSSSSSSGYPAYYPSGLTPPLCKVIQRRYLARYEERDTKPIPPAKKDVAAVEKEIQVLISKLNSTKNKQPKKGSGSGSAPIKTDKRIIEEVEEEIVDYESWMGNGGILYTTDEIIKLYPECWLTKSELQAMDSQNHAVQDEQRKRKEETARLAQQKLENEQAKLQAKADKKAKKKEEKMKNKRLSDGTVEKGKKALAATTSVADEIDEVTAAAMTITAGGDEDFLFDGMGDGDDMFDFDNEDITDLLG